MKKTKIICSIGPSSCSTKIMTKMVEAGMNVARINFSHATDEEKELIEDKKKQAKEEKAEIKLAKKQAKLEAKKAKKENKD